MDPVSRQFSSDLSEKTMNLMCGETASLVADRYWTMLKQGKMLALCDQLLNYVRKCS
jgi:hypothetical protein